MAKPRVFISSTFYDLRQVRADIEQFLRSIGYDPVRNEEGAIPYGKEESLEQYCYNEIKSCDILISIIGGNFGTESRVNDGNGFEGRSSISQQELKTALKENRHVYIFIDKNVKAEFETYRLNKATKGIKYRYVNDVRIYNFIDEIISLPNNNNIKDFETSADIVTYLREQFAGLFHQFISRQDRERELNLIERLQGQTETLDRMIKYLSDLNKDHKSEMEEILMLNHPLIGSLRKILHLTFKFYISNIDDLTGLLTSRSYLRKSEQDDSQYYVWIREFPWSVETIKIAKILFRSDGHLKFLSDEEWNKSYVMYDEKNNIENSSTSTDVKVPF